MGKDLRTTPVELKLHRYGKLDASAWGLRNAQPFFPPLEKLFKTETVSSFSEYGVRLNNEVTSVLDKDTVRTVKGKTVPVHRKTTMILNPFRWMRGDYGDLALPKPTETAADIQQALQSPHTAGYVGAIASIALSESGCPHFPSVYGVYTGIAEKHTIDISDDYEDLSDRHWFGNNIGKTFDLKLRTEGETTDFRFTRGQRPNLCLGDEDIDLQVEDIHADHVSEPSNHTPSMSASSQSIRSKQDDESSSNDSSDVFEIRSCACESEEEEEVEDEMEDDEPFAWATFSNVPVITTVMEKCEGTFYDLMKMYPNDYEKYAAWLSQVIFALAFAQRNYGFVHNDLHGNNVMYVPTTQEYLYYKLNGICYKLPTHGYLIKIIDFDRCIVSLRLYGMKEPRQFVSSQFHQDEEAAGQYNMEPFFDAKHPHIPPSSSFDLARLATSLFWDMFPEGPSHSHPLSSRLQEWMKQSDGTSVMFRRQMDDHDRYHGFDLYKAIARYCKDSVPRKEIQRLGMFQVPSIPVGSACVFIEN